MPGLLIVDDDEYIRTGLRELIDWEEMGVEIVGEAEGGRQAFQLFLDRAPQIVLTDIRMPDGDGLELIRNIRDKKWNTRIIVLSGYDDYDYVRQAMRYQVEDYLLKPVDQEELIEIVKSCCEKLEQDGAYERLRRESFQLLRDNVFMRWAENRIDPEQLREKMHFLNLDFGAVRTVQAAVIAWQDANEGELPERERQFRSFAIWNSMEEAMQQHDKGIAFLNPSRQIVCVFWGGTKDTREFAERNKAWLRDISEQYAAVLKTPWYCALGVPVQPHSLHVSYRDALQLLDMMPLTGPVQLVDRGELTAHLKQPIPDIADRETIMSYLVAGRKDKWEESLDFDFQWALTQPHPLAAAKYVASKWVSAVKDIERKFRLDKSETDKIGETALALIFEATNVPSIRDMVRNRLVELEGRIRSRIARKRNPIVQEVEAYVQAAFREDLALKTLADKFNVNSIYLGRLFREETGEYFSDYLNRLRLEEAKRLLRETSLKAAEIAQRTGFRDPNYFYRKFKQSVGLSPTEYRDLIRSGKG